MRSRGRATLGAAAALLVIALTTACGAQPTFAPVGTTTPAAATVEADVLRDRLAPLVLQPEDLAAIGNPSDWQVFDEGPLLRADMPGGLRSDPRRFGRLGGWKSRYRVTDPAATRIAFVIESRVDLFTDASGPIADLQAAAQDAPRTGARVAPAPRAVGEAALGLVSEQPQTPSVGYYTIIWRRGPILASIVVSGFKGSVSLEQAMALAEAVDRRLVRAGG